MPLSWLTIFPDHLREQRQTVAETMATLLKGFDDSTGWTGGFVAIGNFDGVHTGHQSMIEILVGKARAANVPAVVLTFQPHPIRLLRPEKAPPSLSTIRRKTQLLGHHGVDYVVAYPTNRDLLNLSPRDFFDQIIVGKLKARGLIEGPNFFFGRDRAGDVSTLKQYCAEADIELTIVQPVTNDGSDVLVSSSLIRKHIAAGELEAAIDLLGHPYQMEGIVTQGAQRGRTLGFATANLSRVETLLPVDGVYGGRCEVNGNWHRAAINIGPNPTFADDSRKVEVHLLDLDTNLYGAVLNVDLITRIRATRAFASVDELRTQIQQDVDQIRQTVPLRP